MNKGKSVVSFDLLEERESCHGHRVYVLNSSPAAEKISIPISQLILPELNAPELMLFYGFIDFISYEEKD